ncbi:MAG: PstS family phosphate ABC transporter substrate-binding protein [Planctomycetaceae bacterium]
MSMSWTRRGWLACSVALLSMAGCSNETVPQPQSTGGKTASGEPSKEVPKDLTGKVQLDGSSTVFPVSEAVAEEFKNKYGSGVQVTVGLSGTGGGFKKFLRNEIDIADASRPILTKELDEAKAGGLEFYELPICFDALTVVVHKDASWVDSITIAELKKIWEPAADGKVMKWSDVREGWPAEPLALYGAGTDSGTFDYFTEAVNGKAKASRPDYTPSEDDNTLVTGVSNNKYALGYVPYAYFEPNQDKMKALKIDWKGDGNAVAPSPENIMKGTYMPLSRPLFIYVGKKAAERPECKAFVEFYLDSVKELCAEVKYLPLPDDAYGKIKKRFADGNTGTAFGGEQAVGLAIEEILSREVKN